MNDLQWKASNPDHSVWVSASAGTGKTKILTDRVLRLLLEHASPAKILCLTFTNAAANEMQSRINSKLADWANIGDEDLSLELQIMLGRTPTLSDLKHARTLFNTSLHVEDKIEIHTIHSYCQKILKRFPLEAKVSPGFQILDDIKTREIISKIKNQIYLSADCQEIVHFFTSNFHEIVISKILDEIIKQRLKFKKLSSSTHVKCPQVTELKSANVFAQTHSQIGELLEDLIKDFPAFGEVFYKDKTAFGAAGSEHILSFFLTKDGDKKQRLILKKLADQYPELLNRCEYLQEMVHRLDQFEKTREMFKYTELLEGLAHIIIREYEKFKESKALLDYDDLIYFTKNLLKNAHVRDWVLYKLDGGIEHLLVDEAQDTSPEQWEIIDAMVVEFYSGISSKESKRTIFVVGDEKQSIFSFQGANLSSLNLMNHNLKSKFLAAKKNYEVVNLEYSYRSTPAVLDVVYNVFERIKRFNPKLFHADIPKILPFRANQKGKVELWPLVKAEKSGELFWPKSSDYDNTFSPSKQLAIKIASYIKDEISSGKILASTGLPVRSQDFMILVRKRDKFAQELINQLKIHALQTAGIDRMILSENLSVMDLIAVAKFTLTPNDDLNLAALLKSPFIGLTDSDLQKLTSLKGRSNIWEILSELNLKDGPLFNNAYSKLKLFKNLYDKSDVSNFFHIIVDALGYRKILVQANGFDSNDAINELLYLSFSYSLNVDNSLQSFIYWFETNEVEIKRNVESFDKIKLMTVHGSKGLQAPIVILCDTTSIPDNKNKFFWSSGGELLASRQSSKSPEIFKNIKDQQQLKELQEYVRLLYVGMTRAEDNLIICGYENEKMSQYSWYQLISDSLVGLANVNRDGVIVYQTNFEEKSNELTKPLSIEPNAALIHQVFNENLNVTEIVHNDHADSANLENLLLKNKLANHKSSSNFPVLSPLRNRGFLEFGKIFHKILEDSIKTRNFSNMFAHPLIGTLPQTEQDKIHLSINNLMNSQEFHSLITGDIKTEISIGFLSNGQVKLGRIDFLSIENDTLTIIDYKSDANPPTSLISVPKPYFEQLEFYSTAVKELYPNHKIFCKILWLQNGKFMNIL